MRRLPIILILPAVSILGLGAAMAAPLSLSPGNIEPLPPPPAADAVRPPPSPPFGGGLLEFIFGGPAFLAPGAEAPDHAARSPDASVAEGAGGHAALDPRFERQVVGYSGNEAPGTIIINTQARFLYLIEAPGRAVRYGIGVGRSGFRWAGIKQITMKRQWPDWRPPDEMLRRRPDLPRYMPGGPENPLGARALYLGSSLYRIHGSNEPWTIGTAVSSGCIRMRNEDVIDLYERVKVGTKVMVI
jgi:lipoprotein-anchoring transpeptidase ErfK/SrfK